MTPEPDAALRRMGWLALALGAAAAVALALWRGPAAGAGAALGVLLARFNFQWLKTGLNPRFALRYAVLAAALYGIFISHLVPFGAVVFGLFSVPAAALAEACRQLFFRDP